MRDIGEHCVAAAETVSRGDLGIGPGSGGRKGGSPPCPGQRKQLPGTYFRLHASNHRPCAVGTGDEKTDHSRHLLTVLLYTDTVNV